MPTLVVRLLDKAVMAVQGKTVAVWFTRASDGRRICIADTRDNPSFYVLPKQGAHIAERLKNMRLILPKGDEAIVLGVEPALMSHNAVDVHCLKVMLNTSRAVRAAAREAISWDDVEAVSHHDMSFLSTYCLGQEHPLLELYEVQVDEIPYGELNRMPLLRLLDARRLYKDDPSAREFLTKPLRIAAFHADIHESSLLSHDHVIAWAFADDRRIETMTWKTYRTDMHKTPYLVEFVKGEVDLIEEFTKEIRKRDCDILFGHGSDRRDLSVITARAEHYRMPFSISWDGSTLPLRDGRWMRYQACPGTIYIDLAHTMRRILEKMTITQERPALETADKMERHTPDGFTCATRSHDRASSILAQARVIFAIYQELARLGLPFFITSRMTLHHLLEAYLLREMMHMRQFLPSRPTLAQVHVRAAHVYRAPAPLSMPGMYDNVIVVDIRLMTASLIEKFNLSDETYCCSCCREDGTPLKRANTDSAWVCRRRTAPLASAVRALRERYDELSSTSLPREEARMLARSLIELMIATIPSHLNHPRARYFSAALGSLLPDLAEQALEPVIALIRSRHKLLHADGNYIFLSARDDELWQNTIIEANALLDTPMNLRVKKTHMRALFIPSRKGSASRKYALIDPQGLLETSNLDARGTCAFVRTVHKETVRLLLEEGGPKRALAYAQQQIERLLMRSIIYHQLVMRHTMGRPLSQYEVRQPHVRVAHRMFEQGIQIRIGSIIPFVIIKGDGQSISERARHPNEASIGDIDVVYYANHHLIPTLNAAFSLFGCKIEDVR